MAVIEILVLAFGALLVTGSVLACALRPTRSEGEAMDEQKAARVLYPHHYRDEV